MRKKCYCKNCLTEPSEKTIRDAERLDQPLICQECLSTEFFLLPRKRKINKFLRTGS